MKSFAKARHFIGRCWKRPIPDGRKRRRGVLSAFDRQMRPRSGKAGTEGGGRSNPGDSGRKENSIIGPGDRVL